MTKGARRLGFRKIRQITWHRMQWTRTELACFHSLKRVHTNFTLSFFFVNFLMQAVLRITKTYATHIALHMYQLEVLITLAVCMVQLNKLITHWSGNLTILNFFRIQMSRKWVEFIYAFCVTLHFEQVSEFLSDSLVIAGSIAWFQTKTD